MSLLDPAESAALSAAVRARGGDARVLAPGETVSGACGHAFGVVVEMSRTGGGAIVQSLDQLRHPHPGVQVVVVHDQGDIATSWVAMWRGATPWLRTSQRRSVLECGAATAQLLEQLDRLRSGSTVSTGRAVRSSLDSALINALAGRTHQAILELCRIEVGEGTALAVEIMTDMSAQLLRQMEHRARYPIPLCHVVERFSVDSEDVEPCLAFLYNALFRNADVVLDSAAFLPRHTAREQVYGAFQVLAAIVRFVAARWWTSPDAVLDRLQDGGTAPADVCTGT